MTPPTRPRRPPSRPGKAAPTNLFPGSLFVYSMKSLLASLIAIALLAPALAGCIAPTTPIDQAESSDSKGFLEGAVFNTTGKWSSTLSPGPLGLGDILVERVKSYIDGTEISIGLFFPDAPEGTTFPVIMDVGPYYGNGDLQVDEKANRLGGFLIENFVPYGYVVAQVSVRGTGWSDGCMDFMGAKEQADIDSIVTWVGEQAWSNGAVGMIGRSYDGSTPWQATQFGNPVLKTIVPISGLSDIGAMYFRNGSAEARAPILGSLYSSYAIDGEGRSPQQQAMIACPETPEHPAWGAAGVVNGGGYTPVAEMPYWKERNFIPETLKNYKGSVFLIHGLQDWNVEPTMAIPLYNDLDVDKKLWLGQWGHNYPDRPAENDHWRMDWAEVLRLWFDKYLKGMTDVDTGPAVEVEDSLGNWRAEPANAFPPMDANWTTYYVHLEEIKQEKGTGMDFQMFDPAFADESGYAPTKTLDTATAAFEEDVRFAGLPQLHLTVTPTTSGGHLLARLYDEGPDGKRLQVGRAWMDLRYHKGGTEIQAVVPGMPILVAMEIMPLDVLIPAGHKLVLTVQQEDGIEPVPSPATGPVTLHLGEYSTLRLPMITRDVVDSQWDVDMRVPSAAT